MITETVLLFAVMFAGLALRLPVILALLLTLAVHVFILDVMPAQVMAQKLISGMDKPALAAILYFLLAGMIMTAGGMTARLIDFAKISLSRCRGSLAQVNVGGSLIFGGMTGSAVADTVAMGAILVPAMRAERYPVPYAAALTASSSVIGLLIPPSIPMVLLGIFTNTNIGELFIAGILPGFLMTIYLMSVVGYHARTRGYPSSSWPGFDQWKIALRRCIWVLLMPFVIVGCLWLGVATATEIGAIAVLYSIIVSTLFYRELTFRRLMSCLAEAATDGGQILCLIAVTGGVLWILAVFGTTSEVVTWLMSLSLSPTGLLFAIAFILVGLGTFASPSLLMILVIPTLFPVSTLAGIDPLHFGVVAVTAVALGLVTPPVGFLVFVAAGQARVSVWDVFKAAMPFVVALLMLLLSLIFLPFLSTWLPQLLR